MGRSADGRLKQRALHSDLDCLDGLLVALGGTDSDMSHALVLHNRLHIGEIQIDQRRQIDQVRDSLYRLLKHLVGLLQSVRHGSSPVHNLQKFIVGDHNQGIHVLLQLFDARDGVDHTGLRLKLEGLGHNADRKDPLLLGQLRHDGGSSGSGSAAHSTGNEHHVRALDGSAQLLGALLGRLLADLRLRAGAQSLCQLLSDLNQRRRLAERQRLLVGVDTDELHSANILINHSIYGIISCASHTNHDNFCAGICFVCHNL